MKWIGTNKEICKKDYGRHEKGEPMMFGYRLNSVTGEIDALYHCKKCQKVLHFPLSKNPKEKELYEERKIKTKNFKKPIKE